MAEEKDKKHLDIILLDSVIDDLKYFEQAVKSVAEEYKATLDLLGGEKHFKEVMEKQAEIKRIYENIRGLKGPVSVRPAVRPVPEENKSVDKEILRQVVKEELININKKEPQTVIYINQKNIISTGGDKHTQLHNGGAELLRMLSGYNTYLDTDKIANLSKTYNTVGSVNKGKAKLNRKIKLGLGLADVILSKKGSGYMINNLYRISSVK